MSYTFSVPTCLLGAPQFPISTWRKYEPRRFSSVSSFLRRAFFAAALLFLSASGTQRCEMFPPFVRRLVNQLVAVLQEKIASCSSKSWASPTP
eukprot:658059-Amphidinium_carterae.1